MTPGPMPWGLISSSRALASLDTGGCRVKTPDHGDVVGGQGLPRAHALGGAIAQKMPAPSYFRDLSWNIPVASCNV